MQNTTTMKIELRSIQIHDRLTEETTCFNAKLYVNGIYVGDADNRGTGGPTDVRPLYGNKKAEALFKEAEAHCLTLPPIKYPPAFGMEAFEVAMNLENFVDEIVEKFAEQKSIEKTKKKLEKAMPTCLCFGTVNEYTMTWFKGKPLLSAVLATPKGKEAIAKAITEFKQRNLELINTNIPDDVLEMANDMLPQTK